MKAVWSPSHRLHAPVHEVNLGLPIPTYESPARAENILTALRTDSRMDLVEAVEHGRTPIERVHDVGLIDFLETAWPALHARYGREEYAVEVVLHPGLRAGMGDRPAPTDAEHAFGWWCYETATPLAEGTYAAARSSVDVALTAAQAVVDGDRAAYGLCRPPGHHAARSVYGGFCYFNNAAVVAEHLRGATGERVTVLDVDYHHGNGTQQIFYDRGDVQFVSLHGDPAGAYPWFVGFAEETGAGPGEGTTLNLPLPPGTDDDAYLGALERAADSIDDFGPGVIVVSLGVDTYHLDPISDLGLTADGYRRCGALVGGLGRPVVVLQEGGYAVDAIGDNVHAWLDGLLTSVR